jgi:hypothetical protein
MWGERGRGWTALRCVPVWVWGLWFLSGFEFLVSGFPFRGFCLGQKLV